MFSLKGKSAAVTGGGSGIGRAVALVFAQQGATVHILDLSEAAGRQVAAEIDGAGGKAHVYACDVSNQQQVTTIFQQIGTLDILVNNAGISHIGRADNTTEAD